MAWLEARGLFRGRTGNAMRLGLCSRSKDVIEPVLKPQWWVACGGMAADACAAVRDGRIEIIPSDFEATWFRCAPRCPSSCTKREPLQALSMFCAQVHACPRACCSPYSVWVIIELLVFFGALVAVSGFQ